MGERGITWLRLHSESVAELDKEPGSSAPACAFAVTCLVEGVKGRPGASEQGMRVKS